MRPALWLSPFVALASCVEAGDVAWPEADFDLAFVVEVKDGVPTAPIGPLTREQTWISSLRGDLDRSYLVTLETARLAELDLRMDEVNLELELGLRSAELVPACEEEGLQSSDDQSLRVERPLESAMSGGVSRVFRFEPRSTPAAFAEVFEPPPGADWSLRYHQRPCLEGRTIEVRPFGPSATVASAFVVRHIDDDTVVVGGIHEVQLIERGAAQPAWAWNVETVLGVGPDQHWDVLALDVDARDWPAGPVTIVGAARLVERSPRDDVGLYLRAAVFELQVTRDGVQQFHVRWNEETIEPNQYLDLDLRFDGRGGYLMVGAGLILTATAASATPSVENVPGFAPLALEPTGDPLQPFAIGAEEGIVLLGDPRLGIASMVTERVDPTPRIANIVSLAPRREDGELVIYAGTHAAALFVRRQGQWSELRFDVTPNAIACAANPDCGRNRPAQNNGELDLGAIGVVPSRDDQLVLFGLFRCLGMFARSKREACALAASVDGSPIRYGPTGSAFQLRASSQRGETIVFGGSPGVLYEVRVVDTAR